VELKDIRLKRALRFEMDEGEAAAIALALELGFQQILMDERDGRVKARAIGLRPVGVLGILLRAKRDGRLDSIEGARAALRHEAGFFIANQLFEAILVEAGERHSQEK
jgi:predicted nucleic acid-binding protein